MDKLEKENIINETNENIDKISNSLKINNNETKKYIENLNESDLKIIKEFNELIKLFKKPFFKISLWIILISSLVNLIYQLGFFIGKFIGYLGL